MVEKDSSSLQYHPSDPLFYHFLATLPKLYATALILLFVATVISAVIYPILRIFTLRYESQKKMVLFEITPPTLSHKAPEATEQLLIHLHTLTHTQSRTQYLLQRKPTFAMEIVSTRAEGIRFLVRLPVSQAPSFQRQLAAYLPDAQCRQVDDYMPQLDQAKSFSITDYRQARHFAYPLASHDSLTHHDPIAYITSTMAKVRPGELMVYQLVISPADTRVAQCITNRLANNQPPHLWLHSLPRIAYYFYRLFKVPISIFRFILHVASHNQPQTRRVSPSQQAVYDSLSQKLTQPLFQVSLRCLVATSETSRTTELMQGLHTAIRALAIPGYQSLVVRRDMPYFSSAQYQLHAVRTRLPSLFSLQANTLAASELATLYHVPYGEAVQNESIGKSLSKTLPAPLALRQSADTQTFDVILGQNQHHSSTTPIGLTAAEREHHVYIIGGTGNGKTTMLQYAIVQDMQQGKGIAVVDPHGDMAEMLLGYVPPERITDVIYFNPDDIGYPIGLNLLELDPDLSGDALLREKDIITEALISVFRKIFSDDDAGGHRIEYILRNTIQTALTVPDATIFTIYELLNDPTYRRQITNNLEDTHLKNFWKHELGKAGDMQRVKMAGGITAKIGRFLFSASAKRILEQPQSTVDFEDIINSGKILICNFSKGLIGEDTSELFGIMVLAKLQLASLRRARQAQVMRQPFYLYVDEFQNFATPSFVQMLSESRKYKLYLTMAEQSTAQQADQQMVQIILANVGTILCFRTGNPADEKLMLPLFEPYIETGEIANLKPYTFYARFSATTAQEPLSGKTILLAQSGDPNIADIVTVASRKQYARKYTANNPTPATPTAPRNAPKPPKIEADTEETLY